MNNNETMNKYINIISNLFNQESQKLVHEKLMVFLNKKSGEEVTIKDLIEVLGEPDIDFYDLYEKGAKKLIYQGLIIEEKKEEMYHYYGETLNQIGSGIFSNLVEQMNNNYQDNLVDKLLFKENMENNPFYLIVKLLIFVMNNYYDNYDKLLIDNKGIIDCKISLLTKHGSLFQTVPINDFIYGLFVDGLYTERQFDKYLKKGSYQLLCEELDKLFNSNDIIDNDIIKKHLITIANMFNNKMFYLTYYGIIDYEQKNKLIKQFNIIFNQTLQSLGIIFYQDDFVKIEEAKNHSIERLNKPLENL